MTQGRRAATAPPVLPLPRRPGRYSIALVCLGNICRSPMADVVLSARVAEAGLADRVEVESSGTGGWHVGDPMDDRAAATLTAAGYDASRHRAQQFAPAWLERHDLVLAMDAQNLRDVGGPTSGDDGGSDGGSDGGEDRVRLFRSLDPSPDGGAGPTGDDPAGDVPDPYYGGPSGFEEVLAMVERTCAVLVAALPEVLDAPEPAETDRR